MAKTPPIQPKQLRYCRDCKHSSPYTKEFLYVCKLNNTVNHSLFCDKYRQK